MRLEDPGEHAFVAQPLMQRFAFLVRALKGTKQLRVAEFCAQLGLQPLAPYDTSLLDPRALFGLPIPVLQGLSCDPTRGVGDRPRTKLGFQGGQKGLGSGNKAKA